MTVTIRGIRHVEILRDRTDSHFTGRTLRILSEFGGGEILINLTAREVSSLAVVFNETRKSLVRQGTVWMNADQVPVAPLERPVHAGT